MNSMQLTNRGEWSVSPDLLAATTAAGMEEALSPPVTQRCLGGLLDERADYHTGTTGEGFLQGCTPNRGNGNAVQMSP
jgi:hypothetical protein